MATANYNEKLKEMYEKYYYSRDFINKMKKLHREMQELLREKEKSLPSTDRSLLKIKKEVEGFPSINPLLLKINEEG